MGQFLNRPGRGQPGGAQPPYPASPASPPVFRGRGPRQAGEPWQAQAEPPEPVTGSRQDAELREPARCPSALMESQHIIKPARSGPKAHTVL